MIRPSPAVALFLVLSSLPHAGSSTEPGAGHRSENRPPGSDVPPGPIFRDLAAGSGLDFVHVNGMSGELYIVENLGAGGALFDYDNDGDLDVYLPQGHELRPGPGAATATDSARLPPRPTDRLFRNDTSIGTDGRRTLRFSDVTEEAGIRGLGYGMGVAAGDYDNDGWIDLYVTNWGANQLLHNDGNGTFSDRTQTSGTNDLRWSVPAAFFDYDRDGWLDLFVGNYVDFIYARHRACATETGDRDYCDPLSYQPEPDRLFRNRGDGAFEDVTTRAGLQVAYGPTLGAVTADFDRDGWIDLYVANDLSANQLWINQGDGTFQDHALLAGCAVNRDGQPEASMGVDAGDFDEDGDDDLFLTHLTRETNTLFVNDGRALFNDRTLESGLGTPSWKYTSFGTGWIDYDNDMRLDLLVLSGTVHRLPELVENNDPYPLHQPNQLFRNLGGGRFEEVGVPRLGDLELSEVSRGAAFGDVDNDGDVDVLVTNNNGPVRLLVNQVGASSHWLGLRLLAREGGGDVLGARVAVTPRHGPTLWRRSRSDGSYASASDPRIVVGLGGFDEVDRVRVWWPGGGVEEWGAIGTDAYTTLRQGTGRPADRTVSEP